MARRQPRAGWSIRTPRVRDSLACFAGWAARVASSSTERARSMRASRCSCSPISRSRCGYDGCGSCSRRESTRPICALSRTCATTWRAPEIRFGIWAVEAGTAAPRTVSAASAAAGRRASASLNALDDDPVRLDRHLDAAVAGRGLGVDGVVLDGRVEPQAEAVLLAVVERGLHRGARPIAAPAPASPAAPATPAASGGRLALGLLGVALGLLGLGLGLGLGDLLVLGCLAQRFDLGLD